MRSASLRRLVASLSALSLVVFTAACGSLTRPHVVVLLADDLGWNDVGYHGGEIPTPHIDALARSGVRMERFYVSPMCTATRASLLTGRYPIRYGLQQGSIAPWASHGLPTRERTLAEALRALGYRTSLIGKWHLGHARWEQLPTRRGFDRQYGSYNGSIDYFSHENNGALDWHRDDAPLSESGHAGELVVREAVRQIAQHDPRTPLFLYVAFNVPHAPLQPPRSYSAAFDDLEPLARRRYAALVASLDSGVGAIVDALEAAGMRERTLVVFASDNGGNPRWSDNRPLRDGKLTAYEGGVRVPAVASWPGRLEPRTLAEPVHVVDLFPTLQTLAGGEPGSGGALDGVDLWPLLDRGESLAPRDLLLLSNRRQSALLRADWKLVATRSSNAPAPGAPVSEVTRTELFDVATDPGEWDDRAASHPDRVADLSARLARLEDAAVPRLSGRPRPDGWAPAIHGPAGSLLDRPSQTTPQARD